MERALQNLGFTQAEAKVYLSLLRQGPVRVGAVIAKTGLQSSTVHNTLHALLDKGFVTYMVVGRVRRYSAASPAHVLDQYKEKATAFADALPRLEVLRKLSEQKHAEVYEGTKGVIAMLSELIREAKQGDSYCFFAVDVSGLNEEIQEFFRRYDAKRKEKKLQIRGLARRELQTLFTGRKFLNVRYVDFPIPSNISICNHSVALIDWREVPSGILVRSKQIAESELLFFDELWKHASATRTPRPVFRRRTRTRT